MLEDVIGRISSAELTFGTSGNASERIDQADLFRITPSGLSWQAIAPEDLPVLSIPQGIRVRGSRVPSTEWRVHQALYAAYPWIGGIVHLHSEFATILSIVGMPVKPVHYQMARIGNEVPVLPYHTFGTPALAEAVVGAISVNCQAVLVQNHGLFAVGKTVDRALEAAEETEWTASLQYRALLIGSPRILDTTELDRVREAFRHYGQTQ